MKFSEAIMLSKLEFPQNIKNLKVCSNYEMDVFSTYLRGFGGKERIEYKVNLSGYQNLHNSLFNLVNENWDAALIIIQVDDIFPELSYRTSAKWLYRSIQNIVDESDDRIQKYMDCLFDIIRKTDFPILIFPPLLKPPPLENYEKGVCHTSLSILNIKIEAKIYEYVTHMEKVDIINIRGVFSGITYSDMWDSMMFFQAGNPFSPLATCCLAEAVHKWFSYKIQAKKLLITDLDNTLWRGIIGEDGPENISSLPEGNTYHHYIYQKFLKLLSTEGILLAVSSKNNPSDVEGVFQDSQYMEGVGIQLKKEDFVQMSSSWEPKSQQIKRICKELNLLPVSVVFVDDNPVELFEVKNELPEIEAIEFPTAKDIHKFLKTLRKMFSNGNITTEDEERSKLYQIKNNIDKSQSTFASYKDFLISMKMNICFKIINHFEEKRPFQLYNKANQFNLTGKRLREEEWLEYVTCPQRFCVSGTYRDNFGEQGVVFVALLEIADNAVTIVNAVLSCRVFNRGIEVAFLDWITQHFLDIREIKGKIQGTDKNAVCLNYYIDNGFDLHKVDGEFKIYNTQKFYFKDHYLKIESPKK